MKTLVVFSLLAALIAPLAANNTLPLTQAASKLIGQLDEAQKKKALFPFQSEERENWHYVPTDREGIRIDALNDPQKEALQKLLAASLSAQGVATAQEVIQLEALLYERSNQSDFRHPGKYTTAIFGTPSAEKPWGWRFEGHHLSLNFTVASDKVALTAPFFFGTNPAEVREGKLKGLRPLGTIEDAARALALQLHGEGHHVRYTNEPPSEILTGQDRSAEALAKEGITFSALNAAQQKELLALVQQIAAKQKEDFLAITAKDLSEAQFAWAGDYLKDEPHYFRIQTPKILIEYANTQNGANHAHLVWRDFQNDFGRDLLKEHLEHDH